MNSCSDSSNDSVEPNVNHVAGVHTELHMNFSAACKPASQERYVWEMRTRSPNVTPASTVLNSPDLNAELQYAPMHHHQAFEQVSPSNQMPGGYLGTQQQPQQQSAYYYQRPHPHQIRVGRSPGSSQFEPEGIASPGSPTDVGKADGQCLRDGEIVVFDDIDTNWINKSAPLAPERGINEDVLKVTKMIGQLPIAEYEGSPRRFGNQQASAKGAGIPKRPPGFPQRVSPVKQRMDNNVKASVGNLIDLLDHEGTPTTTANSKTPTFDYLYEFSETRKVLEEFFKGNPEDDEKRFTDYATESGDDVASSDIQPRVCDVDKHIEQAYIGQRLARIPKDELYMVHRSPRMQSNEHNAYQEHNDIELYIDSNSRSSGDLADTELEANLRRHSRNFTLSPETTDYDSNCGDLDSLSNDINCTTTDYGKLYTSMPVLEDGLSSGHASDTENNVSVVCDKQQSQAQPQQPQTQFQSQQQPPQINHEHEHNGNSDNERLQNEYNGTTIIATVTAINAAQPSDIVSTPSPLPATPTVTPSPVPCEEPEPEPEPTAELDLSAGNNADSDSPAETHYSPVYAAAMAVTASSKPAAAAAAPVEIQEAMKEIRSALQRAKTQPDKLKFCDEVLPVDPDSPVWVPRKSATTTATAATRHEEEEADTDLETDRLLGQQDFFAEQTTALVGAADSNANGLVNNNSGSAIISDNNNSNPKLQTYSSATIRQGIGTSLTPNSPDICQIVGNADVSISSPEKLQYTKSPTGSIKSLKETANSDKKTHSRNKEGFLEPKVLIEGVLFRARYLGSTQLVCEGQPTKSTRMMQAEEAVSRIKAPEGESQPSTEVDLFISTEKIMVLNTDLKEIMMDHALRTISYIADIGDLVVLMARRRFLPNGGGVVVDSLSTPSPADTIEGEPVKENNSSSNKEGGGSSNKHNRTPKMICHVFESDEAQFIAQSIGQAFQVAYMEFLKANGIENENLAKEMDYQEVLNSQEIFGDELEIFAKKELQKEVVVPKAKGEILGVVIVESGWGSMLPTVVIANLMSGGAAARCGQLNIGDQLIAINGMSLVGLPLSTCQNYIRNAKNQTAVKFTVVPCPPVVEVKILRPKALFQLGFSVQNGVICSLLRGGIAERGGVRVGHRIIEINNQSVVAVPHDTIVKLLSSSVGEILMKTMPTSMFRLLTGQETPIYI
ncbi:uncharacterized protein LOC115764404 isoform X2 [Drosophila novamexicana]|uniref:uncharacterized protein LOC115764404 isoform X2 n=1 Tax=Drosophila novamexicana TaxID=47314 RepID=UPI0011E58E08|nr:uncharacterized protein LOC115764404 isoform X2 [Drosophila novamexicana]